MINALIQGTLFNDPVKHLAKNGNPYVTAIVRTPLDSGDSILVSVIAFEIEVIEGLILLSAKDAVCISGGLSTKVYVPDGGDPRPSADLTAHGLLTPYMVKRKRGE